jgi:dipeptidyl aminopeptidase/acylaminoacyl peptidase
MTGMKEGVVSQFVPPGRQGPPFFRAGMEGAGIPGHIEGPPETVPLQGRRCHIEVTIQSIVVGEANRRLFAIGPGKARAAFFLSQQTLQTKHEQQDHMELKSFFLHKISTFSLTKSRHYETEITRDCASFLRDVSQPVLPGKQPGSLITGRTSTVGIHGRARGKSRQGRIDLFGIHSQGTQRGPGGIQRTRYFRDAPSFASPEPLFSGDIKGRSPQYSPDGEHIGFLYAEKEGPSQVWMMDLAGKQMKKLTHEASGVSSFQWQPGKQGIAYLTSSPETAREKALKDRGYDFIYYEENLKNSHLHLAWFDEQWEQIATWQLTEGMHAWDFAFNAQGTQIAVSLSPKNLIDHRYMFRRIYLIDLETGQMKQVSQNEGKLGNYVFSPDGRYLAYAAALNLNDHQVSQAFVIDLNTGSISNLTPEAFRGHVDWVSWKDSETLLYKASEGVYPTLNTVPVKGGKRKVILSGETCGIIFNPPKFDVDFQDFVFTGSTPTDYINLYRWDGKNDPEKISGLNPILQEKKLGKQEVISYKARDGQEIEGILIHPVDREEGKTYPLVVYVHGGPESHHSHGWLSRYSTPGQVMAGKGYLVLYLNYRASTGYGVDFAMEGFMDPAGKEFDDIADGIEWAVREKGADPDRVGLAGGSYGGYASGWFATYYTRYVRAVCMFVGISNNISKRGTTDIPMKSCMCTRAKSWKNNGSWPWSAVPFTGPTRARPLPSSTAGQPIPGSTLPRALSYTGA